MPRQSLTKSLLACILSLSLSNVAALDPTQLNVETLIDYTFTEVGETTLLTVKKGLAEGATGGRFLIRVERGDGAGTLSCNNVVQHEIVKAQPPQTELIVVDCRQDKVIPETEFKVKIEGLTAGASIAVGIVAIW